jgi:hypothetical protein
MTTGAILTDLTERESTSQAMSGGTIMLEEQNTTEVISPGTILSDPETTPLIVAVGSIRSREERGWCTRSGIARQAGHVKSV